VTLSDLVGSIDSERQHGNLSSAIRLFVLDHYQGRTHNDNETTSPPGGEIILAPRMASVLQAE